MRGISPQLTSGRRHTHPHQTPGLPDPLKGHSSLCVRLAPFVTLPNLPNLAKIFWQEEGTGLGLPQGTGGHLVQISMSEPVHRRRSPTPPPHSYPIQLSAAYTVCQPRTAHPGRPPDQILSVVARTRQVSGPPHPPQLEGRHLLPPRASSCSHIHPGWARHLWATERPAGTNLGPGLRQRREAEDSSYAQCQGPRDPTASQKPPPHLDPCSTESSHRVFGLKAMEKT